MFDEKNMLAIGEAKIAEYASNARLIVTSKFHAAIVGLALGIPVILVLENNYYKYSWLEKFIPIYEPNNFSKINWNPPAVTIPQEQKNLMRVIAKKRIRDTFAKYHDICTLSEQRENLMMTEFKDIFYGNSAIDYIENNWNKTTAVNYAFWGVTETAERLFHLIKSKFPKARLQAVYDWSYRSPFCNIVPVPMNSKANVPAEQFIFVTSASACEGAREFFDTIGHTNYFLCERNKLTPTDFQTE
jgi:hypothetical protein